MVKETIALHIYGKDNTFFVLICFLFLVPLKKRKNGPYVCGVEHLMVVNVVLPIGVFWKKSGTSRNIFSTLGERYCVTRG